MWRRWGLWERQEKTKEFKEFCFCFVFPPSKGWKDNLFKYFLALLNLRVLSPRRQWSVYKLAVMTLYVNLLRGNMLQHDWGIIRNPGKDLTEKLSFDFSVIPTAICKSDVEVICFRDSAECCAYIYAFSRRVCESELYSSFTKMLWNMNIHNVMPAC